MCIKSIVYLLIPHMWNLYWLPQQEAFLLFRHPHPKLHHTGPYPIVYTNNKQNSRMYQLIDSTNNKQNNRSVQLFYNTNNKQEVC